MEFQFSLLYHSRKKINILIFPFWLCFANTEHTHSFTLNIPTAVWHVEVKQQISWLETEQWATSKRSIAGSWLGTAEATPFLVLFSRRTRRFRALPISPPERAAQVDSWTLRVTLGGRTWKALSAGCGPGIDKQMHLLMENSYRKEVKAEISFTWLVSVTFIHLSTKEVPVPK